MNKAALVSPLCTNCKRHQAVVHLAKAGPENWIISTSMRAAPTLSTSDVNQSGRVFMQIHRAMDKIDTEDTKGLLFREVFFVPETGHGQ